MCDSNPNTNNIKFKPGSRPRESQACTYERGYVRQDVYACMLCTVPGGSAGFCVGCKTACHGDHLEEVIDMYSKRHFRCDCGNSSVMRNTCRKKKGGARATSDNNNNSNSENKYGHNFVGKYCRCDRGQDGELGEMFQCVLCEDWFHEKCLNISSRAAKELENVACELVCANCSDNIPLLDAYHARHGLFRRDGNTSGDMNININMNIAHDPDVCIRPPSFSSTDNEFLGMDRLWTPEFRRKLCRCATCREEYARFHVPYLIDPADFVNQADESSSSEEETSSSEEEEEKEKKAAKLPAAKLSAAEKRHIHTSVTSFLEKAAAKPGEFDPQVLKKFVREVRTEILQGKT